VKPGTAPDVPDGWLRPADSEVQRALDVTMQALDSGSDRPAARRLAAHYDPAGRGAGTTFLELAPVEPATMTAVDLHAVTMLNAPQTALTTRRLLHDPATRADIDDALSRLDTTSDLVAADRTTFEAMDDLARLVHRACQDPHVATRSNPWVSTAKLCARKRPRLFPVRDRVVCEGLGLQGTPHRRLGERQVDWQVFAHLMSQHDVASRIEELTKEVTLDFGVRCDAVPLRVLDVALWTWLSPLRRAQAAGRQRG
jgi:hypothetical protein